MFSSEDAIWEDWGRNRISLRFRVGQGDASWLVPRACSSCRFNLIRIYASFLLQSFNLYKMTFLFFGLPVFLYHLRRSLQSERKSVSISFSSSFTHFLISCNCMKTFSLSYTGDSIKNGYRSSKHSRSSRLSQIDSVCHATAKKPNHIWYPR